MAGAAGDAIRSAQCHHPVARSIPNKGTDEFFLLLDDTCLPEASVASQNEQRWFYGANTDGDSLQRSGLLVGLSPPGTRVGGSATGLPGSPSMGPSGMDGTWGG